MFSLKIIEDGYLSAADNMLKDKELLKTVNPNTLILRFYRWKNFSVTYGLSKKAKKDLNVSCCRKNNVDISVRPTGGGIVFHGDDIDFTYTLVAGKNIADKFLCADLTENYRIIHSVVIKALSTVGIDAFLCQKKSDHGMPESCFLRFALNDILYKNKKIAGAAQRMGKNGFLHQGYLSLDYGNCNSLLLNVSSDDFMEYTYPLKNILNSVDKITIFKNKLIEEIRSYFKV